MASTFCYVRYASASRNTGACTLTANTTVFRIEADRPASAVYALEVIVTVRVVVGPVAEMSLSEAN